MKRESILSKNQRRILEIISKEKIVYDNFYLTGGTALSEFYLKHRLSEDLDFFSEEEFEIQDISVFLAKIKKKAFKDYLDSILCNVESRFKGAYEDLKELKEGGSSKGGLSRGRYDWEIPIVNHPGTKPLRWCHAECALIPTKRSLNILFFETGEEDEEKEEK